MFKIVKFCIFVIICIALYFFAESQTDGFRTTKIIFPEDIYIKTKISDQESEKIKNILSQKFYYFKRGRQSFVFESEDKKYVIKFINKSNIFYPAFLEYFSFIKILKKSLKRKDKRYFLTFDSMKLSFDNLKEEAALLHFLIKEKKLSNKKICLISKYKNPFFVDADKTIFLIQKKIDPIYFVLKKMHGQNKLEKGLDSFLDLVFTRCKKQILDDDLNVGTNYGFLNEKAKIVDVGKLFFSENLMDKNGIKKEMLKSTKFLRRWINKNFPNYSGYIEDRIENHYLYLIN